MRTSLAVEKLLEILQRGTETTVELLDIFTSGRSVSYKKLRHYQKTPFRFKTDWAARYSDRQKFYSLLYNLKKQGLIDKKKEKRGTLWQITSGGLEKLKKFEKQRPFAISRILYEYEEEPDSSFKIITFDVPVNEDRKRYWLRAVLKRLGFTMLQKSVWVGRKKVPEAFLTDLRERSMLDYVHIFVATKSGTLRELE